MSDYWKCDSQSAYYWCSVPKEKRAVLLSLIRRTRNKYNAAIAEVGSQNLWQRADLGIAVISSTAKHAEVQLQNVVRFIEAEPRLEVVSLETEIL